MVFDGFAPSGNGAGDRAGRERGVEFSLKDTKSMKNISNIRELNQISNIWKVFDGFAPSGKGAGKGAGRGGKDTKNMKHLSNLAQITLGSSSRSNPPTFHVIIVGLHDHQSVAKKEKKCRLFAPFLSLACLPLFFFYSSLIGRLQTPRHCIALMLPSTLG